jgi:hypothetical protein
VLKCWDIENYPNERANVIWGTFSFLYENSLKKSF